MELNLLSESPAATHALGRALAATLGPGACVALIGELGAGKTAFAAGLGAGLGVAEPLRSPSYLLCCEHRGRLPVLHLDAYFETRMEALLAEGLAERFDAASVLIVEWADRLAAWWPADRLEIRLEPGTEPEQRRIRLRGLGPASAAALNAFAAAARARESAEPGTPAPR